MAQVFKGLRYFEEFRIKDFLEGKTIAVYECDEWRERTEDKTKQGRLLGTMVSAVILEDKTNYPTPQNGKTVSNRYAVLTIKVPKIGLSIPVDTVVELVNPKATVYGDYRCNLSITADDVRPVGGTSGKSSQ